VIAMIKNTGIPKLTLNKKHNSNNYHIVCESVATKIDDENCKENTNTDIAYAFT
jgi:hypothetical protein